MLSTPLKTKDAEENVYVLSKRINPEFYKKSHLKCLYSADELANMVVTMGEQITELFKHRQEGENIPLLITIMNGGKYFSVDLARQIDCEMEEDYLQTSSYGKAEKAGELKWKAFPSADLKNRKILLVDDIIDTGQTLGAIIDYCIAQGASAENIYTAVLLDKKCARVPGKYTDKLPTFAGTEVGDEYLIGNGLDYAEHARNLVGLFAKQNKPLTECG